MMKLLPLWLSFALLACSTPPPKSVGPTSEVAIAGDPAHIASAPLVPLPGPVRVGPEDPSWGDPLAPVTVVMFTDFECPYCVKAAKTFEEVKSHYGEGKLRVVVKHLPLEFHRNATEAARVAASVQRRGGDAAFWAFYRGLMLENGEAPLSEKFAGALLAAQRVSGISAEEFLRGGAETGQKVADDLALAEDLGIRSTPTFMINGQRVSGARDFDHFRAVIDERTQAAQAALRAGTPRHELYAQQTAQAFDDAAGEELAQAKREARAPEPAAAAEAVQVPVGTSAVKGSNDALVTVVMFGDYQCPFCAKGHARMLELEKRFGADIRFVAKHRPLNFHDQAELAASTLEQLRKAKGDVAFFKAHDELYALGGAISPSTLSAVVQRAGLDGDKTLAAAREGNALQRLWADEELADALKVTGTPTYFINGRRMAGAIALEKFEAVVLEELAKARTARDAGAPAQGIYEHLQKTATAGSSFKKLSPGPAPADSPSFGPKNAPVVVQVFTDFECPFCGRHAETLKKLQEDFPTDIRLVVRHLPLPFHKNARDAATLALFARSQKGDAGFFAMQDRMFAAQRDGLGREALLQHAKDASLNVDKARAALESQAFEKVIARDEQRAKDLEVRGTPGTFFNDYFVSGALGPTALRAVLRQALADKGKQPTPAPVKKPAKQQVAAP